MIAFYVCLNIFLVVCVLAGFLLYWMGYQPLASAVLNGIYVYIYIYRYPVLCIYIYVYMYVYECVYVRMHVMKVTLCDAMQRNVTSCCVMRVHRLLPFLYTQIHLTFMPCMSCIYTHMYLENPNGTSLHRAPWSSTVFRPMC